MVNLIALGQISVEEDGDGDNEGTFHRGSTGRGS